MLTTGDWYRTCTIVPIIGTDTCTDIILFPKNRELLYYAQIQIKQKKTFQIQHNIIIKERYIFIKIYKWRNYA